MSQQHVIESKYNTITEAIVIFRVHMYLYMRTAHTSTVKNNIRVDIEFSTHDTFLKQP